MFFLSELEILKERALSSYHIVWEVKFEPAISHIQGGKRTTIIFLEMTLKVYRTLFRNDLVDSQ